MCESSFIDAAMSRALNCYQRRYVGTPTKMLLKLSYFIWLSHPLDFYCIMIIVDNVNISIDSQDLLK